MILGRLAGTCALALIGGTIVAATPAVAQDRAVIGAGVAVVADYRGSDDYRIIPAPIIDVQLGSLFASMSDGVGLYVADTSALKVGASVAFVRGYRQRDVPVGVERLANAPGARLFAKAEAGGLKAGISVTRSLGGTDGIVIDGDFSYPVSIGTRVVLAPSLSTSWASKRHMNRYFGVTRVEAENSGLPVYRAGSGMQEIGAGLTANMRLSSRLNLTGSVQMGRLFDKAADSPLVERRWQPVGFVGVSYGF